jgi:lactose/L-arabinose transport system substrate-binding protein
MTSSTPARRGLLRAAALTLGALLAAGTLAGCGSSDDASDGTTLTVWTWDQPGQALEAAVPAFEQAHPGVTVSVENVGNPAIWGKITTGMAAGGDGLADIMNIGADYMDNYLETFPDGFADLSALGADEYEDDYPAGLWQNAENDEGHVFGLPFEVNTNVLFYRDDLFQQVGIDVSQITTWDELLDAGITLKEQTGVQLFAMDKAASEESSANFGQLLARQAGTFFYDENGDITFNDEGSVAALDFIKRANDAGLVVDVPGGWDNLMTELKGEANVAILPSASWMATVFPDTAPDLAGDWAVRTLPSLVEDGYTASSAAGTFLSVAGSSPHADLAWEFVEFALATQEGQQLVYDGGGLFPAYEPMWTSDGFVEPDPYFDGVPVNQVFIDALSEDTPPDYYTADYAQALRAFTDAQTTVLLDGADPQQALDQAAEQLAQQTGRSVAGS